MADLVTFTLRDAAGARLPGLTIGPAGVRFVGGTAWVSRAPALLTPPTIFEIGNGDYGFVPADADSATGALGVIDGTAAAVPRYVAVQTTEDDDPFQAVLATDDAGALFVGVGSPTISTYKDPALNVLAPPAVVVAISNYLFCFTPSAGDLLVDVAWTLTAQAGANLSVESGNFTGPTASSSSSSNLPSTASAPAVNPAEDLATWIAAMSPFDDVILALEGHGGLENLFVGPVRAVRATVPALAVFCQNMRGQRPDPFLGIGEDFTRFQVDVTVRSDPADFSAGEQLARLLIENCQRLAITGYVTVLLQQSGPDYRGEDDERQHRWVFTVELWWKG